MAENGLEVLKKHPEFEVDHRKSVDASELKKIIGSYQAIVIRSATTLTKEILENATEMKLIVRAGAGVDNIDVEYATERKIPVMNTASANSLAAAEQTIALMFAMLRFLPQAAMSLKDGKWDRKTYTGYEVTGKTLSVIGLGNIGRIVCEKAMGLGMNVIGYDPMIQSADTLPESLKKNPESFQLVTNLDDAFKKADILTVHVPKNEKTTNLINSESLSKMQKGSWVINVARGGIVNEKDVMEACDSGQLSGAAFDVYDPEPPQFPNPLFTHPKVVCAPHLGASTHEAQTRVASTAAEQMVGFFKREEKTGVINLK